MGTSFHVGQEVEVLLAESGEVEGRGTVVFTPIQARDMQGRVRRAALVRMGRGGAECAIAHEYLRPVPKAVELVLFKERETGEVLGVLKGHGVPVQSGTWDKVGEAKGEVRA